MAESGSGYLFSGKGIAGEQPDPWAQLHPLAQRLGVAPRQAGDPPTVVFSAGGASYDIFKLVNAVLDRLDAAAKG